MLTKGLDLGNVNLVGIYECGYLLNFFFHEFLERIERVFHLFNHRWSGAGQGAPKSVKRSIIKAFLIHTFKILKQGFHSGLQAMYQEQLL